MQSKFVIFTTIFVAVCLRSFITSKLTLETILQKASPDEPFQEDRIYFAYCNTDEEFLRAALQTKTERVPIVVSHPVLCRLTRAIISSIEKISEFKKVIFVNIHDEQCPITKQYLESEYYQDSDIRYPSMYVMISDKLYKYSWNYTMVNRLELDDFCLLASKGTPFKTYPPAPDVTAVIRGQIKEKIVNAQKNVFVLSKKRGEAIPDTLPTRSSSSSDTTVMSTRTRRRKSPVPVKLTQTPSSSRMPELLIPSPKETWRSTRYSPYNN